MISFMAGLCVLLGAIWVTRGSKKSIYWIADNTNNHIVGLLGIGAVGAVVVSTWLFVVMLLARGLSTSFGL